MSELPNGWVEAAIGDVCDVLDSRRCPVNAKERAARPGTIPYYGATGQVGWIDQPLFDEELVLLGEDGAPFLDDDKAKAYVIRGPAWVNNHAHVLRARGVTTNRFVFYALNHIDYRPFVNGTTRLKLTQAAMNVIQVPLPPLAEQGRIVAAIEEQFSRLDEADWLLRSAVRRLRTLRDAIQDRAVPESAKRWVSTGEIAEVQGGIQKQPKRAPVLNHYPFLRVANVGRNRLDLVDVHRVELFAGELERFRLIPGDLLVVEGNGSPDQIGRSALWCGSIEDCVHQNHLIRIRPGPTVDPRYLVLFWNAPRTSEQLRNVASSTTGLHTLSTAKVKAILVPLIELEYQRNLALNIEIELSQVDSLVSTIDRAVARSGQLRRSILERAFSGQLVPQDPSDEPASALPPLTQTNL